MNTSNPPDDALELINLAQKRNPNDYKRVVELLSEFNEKLLKSGLNGEEFEAIEAAKAFLREIAS